LPTERVNHYVTDGEVMLARLMTNDTNYANSSALGPSAVRR
jgi:hypothetical protein